MNTTEVLDLLLTKGKEVGYPMKTIPSFNLELWELVRISPKTYDLDLEAEILEQQHREANSSFFDLLKQYDPHEIHFSIGTLWEFATHEIILCFGYRFTLETLNNNKYDHVAAMGE